MSKELGVARGTKQLGVRIPQAEGPPERTRYWDVVGVPSHWDQAAVEQVLTMGGFTGVSADPKRRRALNKRVARWVVKATAKSEEDFKEISTTITDRSPRHLNWEYTIAVTAEKVTPKQHARTHYVDSDFGQKVVRSKRPARGAEEPPAAARPEGVDLSNLRYGVHGCRNRPARESSPQCGSFGRARG